jgi:quercetin dioxygenase-like cupin family protein
MFMLVAAAAIRADDPIVPVYHEPHHRQVFQYGHTRILDLQIPPGDMSWFHTHESPVLYVTLSGSRTRTQNLGQEWGAGGRGRGAAPEGGARGAEPAVPASPAPSARPAPLPRVTSTTSYAQQAVTHRLQNIGDGLFRAIVVLNETPGDETTTEQAAGFAEKAELTNRWFRAYRFTLSAGEATTKHQHTEPVVVVQATSGKGLGVGPMKFEFNEPGQWAFFDAGVAHELRNTGDSSMDLVEVEVRRPPVRE